MIRLVLGSFLSITVTACGLPEIASEFTRGSTSSNGITSEALDIQCNPYRIADGGFAISGEISSARDIVRFDLTAISIRGPLAVDEIMTASASVKSSSIQNHPYQIVVENSDLTLTLPTIQSSIMAGTYQGSLTIKTNRFNHGPNNHEVSCIIKSKNICPTP